MTLFYRSISILFHPIFAPIAGAIAYFVVTPKYSPTALQSGILLPVIILTVIIPIICFVMLKNLNLVRSLFHLNLSERKYVLLIFIVILLMLIIKVIPNNYVLEIYYYFIGLLTAVMSCFFLLFLRFKVSLYVVAITSFLMYLIELSVHFEKNIVVAISLFTLISGLVGTSRLMFYEHSRKEVLSGFVVGIISQLITIEFWI